jgi:hypothetical protein
LFSKLTNWRGLGFIIYYKIVEVLPGKCKDSEVNIDYILKTTEIINFEDSKFLFIINIPDDFTSGYTPLLAAFFYQRGFVDY